MEPPRIHVDFAAGGRTITIRPINPADREIEAAFVRELSAESRYYRFHSALRELTPELLNRFTQIDYPANMALIATVETAGRETQIGVARYAATTGLDRAEVAIVVADAWQGLGVGTRLLVELRELARAAGIRHLQMYVLPENRRMMSLARHLGYEPVDAGAGYGSRELGKTLGPNDDG